MSAHAVTLQLPVSLYEHFRHCAAKARRSLEAEILDAVTKSAPRAETLEPDLEEALAQLDNLDDETLWPLARQRFPQATSEELEALHFKRQSEGLTEEENRTTQQLMRRYERSIALRAKSAALLKQRGHEISGLLTES